MTAGPEVVRTPDAGACARAAADLVAGAVRAGARHLVLAGGTTPMAAYELLDAMDLDWSGVHLWYGDERCVPYDHPDSNHGAVAAALRAAGAVWHPMPGTLGPDAGAAAYAAELEAQGPSGGAFDLVLNGMGPDGHTASLFPGAPQLQAPGLTTFVTDSPKPPAERITLTLGALNAGRRIVLLVTGSGKAPALARVLAGPDPRTPSSLLARERLLVLADAAALDPLPQGEVWLVRHTETEWSRDGRHTGRTDIPLTEAGRAAAAALAPRLREHAFAAVRCSPLGRARDTAALAGVDLQAPSAVLDDDLLEWDYGDYEGITTAQVHERAPDWSLWRDGGPGGERPADVVARVDRVIAEVCAVDGDVLVVAHGHVLRVLGARWMGLEPAAGAHLLLEPGGVCVLGQDRGVRVLRRWNA